MEDCFTTRYIYTYCILVYFLFFFSNLDSKIGGLSTQGSTALGPALAISAGIISGIPQSEVILCTDGEPNVGIGSNPSRGNTSGTFYNTVINESSTIDYLFSKF